MLKDCYVDIHGFQTRHFPIIDGEIWNGGYTIKEQVLIDIWFENMAQLRKRILKDYYV